MKLIKKSSRGRESILGTTYQNFIGFNIETGMMELQITEGASLKNIYIVEMSPEESVYVASWAIKEISPKRKIKK